MSENVSNAEFEDNEQELFVAVINELAMRRESLVRQGVLGINGHSGSVEIQTTDTLAEDNNDSVIPNFGSKPDVLEHSSIRFEYREHELDEAIHYISEFDDTYVYDITSEVMTPTGMTLVPEAYHDEIRDEIITYLGGENMQDLDENEQQFVTQIMNDSLVSDQIVYQKATANYTVSPMHGQLDYALSIEYVIAFEDDIWATVSGASYDSDAQAISFTEVHMPEYDSHENEYAIEENHPVEHEALSPGEHILDASLLEDIIDNETDIEGILSGISDDDHYRRILNLLRQLPSF